MARLSWYNSDEDFEKDIITSVICKEEDVGNIQDAKDMDRKLT